MDWVKKDVGIRQTGSRISWTAIVGSFKLTVEQRDTFLERYGTWKGDPQWMVFLDFADNAGCVGEGPYMKKRFRDVESAKEAARIFIQKHLQKAFVALT